MYKYSRKKSRWLKCGRGRGHSCENVSDYNKEAGIQTSGLPEKKKKCIFHPQVSGLLEFSLSSVDLTGLFFFWMRARRICYLSVKRVKSCSICPSLDPQLRCALFRENSRWETRPKKAYFVPLFMSNRFIFHYQSKLRSQV